jgi:hypothetical protein
LPECFERNDSFVRMGAFNIYGKIADLVSIFKNNNDDLLS